MREKEVYANNRGYAWRKIEMTRDKDECIEHRKVMSGLYSGWVKNVVKPQSGESGSKKGG